MRYSMDPDARFTWTDPSDTETVFTYRALAGPTISDDFEGFVLRRCIVAVRGFGFGDGSTAWEATDRTRGKEPDWKNILPSDLANSLYAAIWNVTHLGTDEQRDSRAPHGSAGPATPMTAESAAAVESAAAGSAPCGETA